MDELDVKILTVLAANARISMRDLGREISLSNTATAERVRRLEEAGAIRGYHADVDWTQTGDVVHAFILIALKLDVRTKPQAFWQYLRQHDHITKIFPFRTGDFDCMIEVYGPDMAALTVIQEGLFPFGSTMTYMADD